MILWYFVGAFLIFVLATLVFDGVHWVLAQNGWCKTHAGRLYLQLGVELIVALLLVLLFPLVSVFLAAVGLTVRFFYELAFKAPVPKTIPAPRKGLVTDAAYHAMHGVFPQAYFGSVFTLFDRIFGTGCVVKGRRIVMTGTSGAFGSPFVDILLAKGAADVIPLRFGVNYTYDDYSACDPALQMADILVLAHGAKGELAMQANCDSFVALIERFKKATAKRSVPPEVWAVGSEIEMHPAWGNRELQVYLESKRAFARHARRYFWDPSFIYRHIVPSAFTSGMGKGLISGRVAALWAWFFIVRGFRYVPVSYTGLALLNWFKFLFRWHAVPAPKGSVKRVA